MITSRILFSSRLSLGLGYFQMSKPILRTMSSSSCDDYSFETLAVSRPRDYVYHVELNRPKKLNAMNLTSWNDIGACFKRLGQDPDCRAIVMGGKGRMFTSGIDLNDIGTLVGIVGGDDDVARKCRRMLKEIARYQEAFSEMEKCPKPVIAAIHSSCPGIGIDLICSADIRYCTADAWFQVKEVDLGLAADVGTLQRLPKIVGSESLVRDLTLSCRRMFSSEAEKSGFVSRVFEDKESLIKGALDMAETIASKSPVAVQNTKTSLIYARDHSVQEGLDYMKLLNMTMLQSEDLRIAAMAKMNKGKEKTVYAKL